jgi:hypothetical protein
VIDTTQFTGPGAVFALILANVRHDYWHAKRGSKSFETAERFLEGGTCVHEGVVYDWKKHRDLIVGSLGIDVRAYVEMVKKGRPDGE